MSEKTWKDHPLVTAVLVAVATTAFCVTVVIPIYTTKLQNDLNVAQAEVIALRAKLDGASLVGRSAATSVADLKSEVETLRAQLLADRAGQVFSPTDMYPLGVRAVRIGDDESAIEQSFGADAIDHDFQTKLWIRVNLKDSPFEGATYYIDKCGPRRIVTHILFRIQKGASNLMLVEKGREIYGRGRIQSGLADSGKTEYRIAAVGGTVGDIDDSGNLHLMSAKSIKCGDYELSFSEKN